jgi:hypothetical protein
VTIESAEIPELIQKARRALELEAPALHEAVERYANNPQKGSPRRMDTAVVKRVTGPKGKAQRTLVTLTQHQARLMLVNAYDHLVSLERLLGRDGAVSVYAHTTLSRAVCEAAVRCAWLLDSDVSTEERLARCCVLLFNGEEDRVRGARSLPADIYPEPKRQELVSNAQKSRDSCHEFIDAAGMKLVLDRKGKTIAHILYPQAKVQVPVKVQATTLMERFLPSVPGWYGMSSATAHSSPWTLQDAVVGEPIAYPLVLSPHPLEIGGATEAALDGSALLIKTYAQYFGHDAEPELRASRQRRGMIDRLVLEHGLAVRAEREGRQATRGGPPQ